MTPRNFLSALTLLVSLALLAPATLAGTIYVDLNNPSCPGSGTLGDPYCTIQLAIDNASNGDVIEVAPGTYNESPKVNGLVITIRGTAGQSATTVQGDGTQAVFTASGDAELTLEGLTVTGGFGPGIPTSGGAVRCNSCALTVTNSTLTGNSAFNGGAGIYFLATAGKKLTVTGSTISNNTAGVGGAIAVQYGAVDVDSSLIENNYGSAGAGAILMLPSLLTITSSVIRNNSTPGSGGAINLSGADLILTNSTVSGNTAGFQGTAIYGGNFFSSTDISIFNSTVTGNAGSPYGTITVGGGYSYPPSTVTATNAILWGNAGPELNVGSATTNITYSDIEGGFAGTGNINADPKFIDAANEDYRLACDSPAIDAGFNFITLPAIDLGGDARKVDGDSNGTTTIDMGSDEFDTLWRFNGPPIVGTNVSFTNMAPPALIGNTARVYISFGDGAATNGVKVPKSGGKRLHLSLDALFNLWTSLPDPVRKGTIAACPGITTVPVQIHPNTPVGLRIYYAGFVSDAGGLVPSVTPTLSFVTQ